MTQNPVFFLFCGSAKVCLLENISWFGGYAFSLEGTWEPRQKCEVALGIGPLTMSKLFPYPGCPAAHKDVSFRDLTSWIRDGGFWARGNSRKRRLRQNQIEDYEQFRLKAAELYRGRGIRVAEVALLLFSPLFPYLKPLRKF